MWFELPSLSPIWQLFAPVLAALLSVLHPQGAPGPAQEAPMHSPRSPQFISSSKATTEGAGVHLRRAFGYAELPRFDPFLMLDDFRSSNPDQYLEGFPWHPHRGIETITYMLEGSVEHADSLGNRGVIGPGGVQWMTAGGGIIHQEMPKPGPDGRMGGFQLWANLPAANKLMPPRYRELTDEDIPRVAIPGGEVLVLAGTLGGITGPVTDVVTAPEYLDLRLQAGASLLHPTPPGHTVFAYVFAGELLLGGRLLSDHSLVLCGDGDHVNLKGGPRGASLLLVSGRPIGEPIAWRGPVVMNTDEEIRQAFEDYRNGTFAAAH
jgi:redox-sensitive bicupin YhaK (pirin superfamily)